MHLAAIADIVLPVYLVVAAGWAYGRFARPAVESLNRLAIDVFVPALMLHGLATARFDLGGSGPLLAGGALILLGNAALAWPAARLLGVSVRGFVPAVSANNTVNVGVPIAVLAFGSEALAPTLLLAQMQMLLTLTLGLWLMEGRPRPGAVLQSPIMIAMVAGLTLSALEVRIPRLVDVPLEMLGRSAIPLVLFGMGARFASVPVTAVPAGLAGAVLRPLGGLAAWLVVAPLLGLSARDSAMLLVFAVLPPAVVTFLFAERYGRDPGLVATIVVLGNLLGIVTLSAAVAWVTATAG